MKECNSRQEGLHVDDLLAMIKNRKYGNRYQGNDKRECIIENPDSLTLNFHQMQKMLQDRKKELLQRKKESLSSEIEKNERIESERDYCKLEEKNGQHNIANRFIACTLAAFVTISLGGTYLAERKDKVVRKVERHLENLENNRNINEALDQLIDAFQDDYKYRSANPLGSEIEKYIGIKLKPNKKERLDDFTEVFIELSDRKPIKEGGGEDLWNDIIVSCDLESATRVMRSNIIEDVKEDGKIKEDIFIGFNYGDCYGWIKAGVNYNKGVSYRVYDSCLNDYIASFEFLDKRSTNPVLGGFNPIMYDDILDGVIKSSICDITLEDDDNPSVEVTVPDQVKQLVRKKQK